MLTTPPSALMGTAHVSQSIAPFLSPDALFSMGTYMVTNTGVGRFTVSATLLGVPLNFTIYAIAPGQFVAIEVTPTTASVVISFEQ